MISFLLSPLGLRIAAGLGVLALMGLLLWSHDSKVRAKEASKWQVKLTQCVTDKQKATDANAELELHYKAFVQQHNAYVQRLADEQAKRLKERDRALAALGLKAKEDQAEIDRLRELASGPPAPTKEISCEQADRILRGLAADVLHDDRSSQ